MNDSKLVVVYYTHTYFLDATLETIQSIKNEVELHIIIELAPESKYSTVINIENLNHLDTLEPSEKVLDYVKWLQLRPYFAGVASVQFLVHKNKKSLSLNSLQVAWAAGKWIKSLNPDIVHFDTISQRAIGMFPLIFGIKNLITIHDPVPHTGEDTWKQRLVKLLFFPISNGFLFYSNFANKQFCTKYPNSVTPISVLRLQPYTFIKQYTDSIDESTDQYILFFGRISKYKGIDILLEAIPIVLKSFPKEKFLIAGKCDELYIDEILSKKYKNNILFINTYLDLDDLAKCVLDSKFVVCPYRDATQSGVLMTTRSLGKTTIATNVGAFPEYIEDGFNGLLVSPDAFDLANTIIKALNNKYYKQLEKNVISETDTVVSLNNKRILLNAYHNCFSSNYSYSKSYVSE